MFDYHIISEQEYEKKCQKATRYVEELAKERMKKRATTKVKNDQ